MSTNLPTESAVDASVDQFGVGTYDSEYDDGEPDHEYSDQALPNDGGSDDVTDNPFYKHARALLVASGMLPGEIDAPTSHKHDQTDTIESPLATTAESALPSTTKNEVTNNSIWPPYGGTIDDVSDTEGFPHMDSSDIKSNDGPNGGRLVASEEENMRTINSILAAYDRGDITLGLLIDKFVGTNTPVSAMTGRTTGYYIDAIAAEPEDPFEQREEEAQKVLEDAKRSNEEHKKFMDRQNREERQNAEKLSRKATNLQLVDELTDGLMKEYGKKNLTKRHVLAYLQVNGQPQHLSSDIIRCLKHRHKVYVKDVLDEFPVSKTANEGESKGLFRKVLEWLEEATDDEMTEDEFAAYLVEELEQRKRMKEHVDIASIRDIIIALEIRNVRDPEVSSVLRRTAAALTQAHAGLERLEGRNG